MGAQPTGTVTLLFTDVEGSTRLLEHLGAERYAEVLAVHRRVLREAFGRHDGYEVDEEGDAFLVAFSGAAGAVGAAREAQEGLASVDWPERVELRVRMGVHTGEALPVPPKYVGIDVHRAARIMAAAHGGQVLVSETSAALLDGTPLRDLGSHRLKDMLEPIALYQLEIEGLPGVFPPIRSLHRTNLPTAAWPLLGRERELAEIRALIGSGARLVTLTGPGGSGKTRLALQAAAELSDQFADGVFFVALAPLRELGAVRATVAEGVGLQPDDDVAAWLVSRRVLLVLDNLEHLEGVASVVSELLVGEVVVLATTRAPLHLSVERELPVEPLPNEAAVELFVSRAAAAGRVIDADVGVAEVCRRLDNLPLALELAAARSRLLSPNALLQRLDAALSLLTGSAADLPERQRTLRATIAWSHDLLDRDAQAAFRRFSVFRGSVTLDAAEAITGADLEQLATLVDQSLLRPLGEARFFLLETLREYARERLDEAGETAEYGLRHARHYLAQLEEIEPVLRGPRTGEFLAWYAEEEDNLRAMLERLTEFAPDEAARAAALLRSYWTARGTLEEARERLQTLLARGDLVDNSRAVLLERLCDIEERLGHLDAAEAAGEEAVALATATDAQHVLTDALFGLAWIANRRGDADEAVRLGLRALEQAAAGQDEFRRLTYLNGLGSFLQEAGRDHESRAAYREAADGFRLRGDAVNEGIALINLADQDLFAADYAAAHDAMALAFERSRQLGNAALSLRANIGAGQALLGLNRRDDARAVFSELFALAVGRDLSIDPATRPVFGLILSGVALTAQPNEFSEAARIRGAVTRLRKDGEFLHGHRDEELYERFEQRLIQAVGRAVWERETGAGAAMTLEETIELARSLCPQPERPQV